MAQPLEDRIPTAAEALAVDPAAAWHRLTHEQQNAVGTLLMKWAAVSGPLLFCRTTPPEQGWGDYTPDQIKQALWSCEDYDAVERASMETFNVLGDALEPCWPQLFGWQEG
jgi:hypothetical protein